jgi:hypothetical protein
MDSRGTIPFSNQNAVLDFLYFNTFLTAIACAASPDTYALAF